MTFTVDDTENDGKIKKEAGQQLNAVLSREGGELYTKFREWCDETGRDPSRVLGDMVLRAMRDESFAQELSGTVIDIGKLKQNQIREDDLELVTNMIDKLDDAEESGDGAMDSIDKMIEQRIQAMGQGPLGNMADNMSDSKGRQSPDVERLESRIQRIEQAVVDGQATQQETGGNPQQEGDDSSVDDIFDGIEDEEEVEGEVTEPEDYDSSEPTMSVDVPSQDDVEQEENVFSTEEADGE